MKKKKRKTRRKEKKKVKRRKQRKRRGKVPLRTCIFIVTAMKAHTTIKVVIRYSSFIQCSVSNGPD